MMEVLMQFVREVGSLFIDMAPYLILGMGVAGLMSAFLNQTVVARMVGNYSLGAAVKAALLGVPLPLCSCGVLPAALYLRDAGASKPAVQAFLISTPQTGFDSLIATYGILGPVMAVYRALASFLLGLFGGLASRITGGKQEESRTCSVPEAEEKPPLRRRLASALRYGFLDFTEDIGVQFIIGLLAAGAITLLVPDQFFTETGLGGGLVGMLLMIAVGIPLYMCSTSSIPVAAALMASGVSPGAAFVLLAAGPATNLATMTVLARQLGVRETVIYVLTLSLGSVFLGLLLDWMITAFGLEQGVWIAAGGSTDHSLLASWLTVPSAVLLAGLLIRALWIRGRAWGSRNSSGSCDEACGCVE